MKKFIMYGFVPAFVSLIAIIQFYNSQTSALSPWKGGGFGMYTKVHPFQQKIVIDNETVSDTNECGTLMSYSMEKKQVLVNPTPKTVRYFLTKEGLLIKENLKLYNASISLDQHTMVYDNLIYEYKSTTSK